MSIAKIVISGVVYRNPEKRFTANNIPVTTFSLNIDENEVSILRVIVRGNNAELVEQSVKKGDKLVIEGRLQISNLQAEDGTEKKVTEVDLSSFEIVSSSEKNINKQTKDVVTFSESEISDTLIDEESIPF